MAKGEQKLASNQAQDIKRQSEQQKTAGIFGGPGSAFGPSGLTGQYQQASNAAFQGIRGAQDTGAYDPGILSNLRTQSLSLGLDPAAQGLYKEYINTGGYSDADKAQYLRQATSGVKNVYSTLSADAARRRAATSGLGGDVTSQMARQLGQAQAESTDRALADVNSQIRTNRLAGAAGLGEAARLQQGAFGAQAALEGNVAQNKLQADQLMQLASTQAGQQILSLMGIDASSQEGALRAMTQLAQQPGMFDNIMKVASVAIGAGGARSGLHI